MSRDKHGGKNHDIKAGYKFSKSVKEFRCLGKNPNKSKSHS